MTTFLLHGHAEQLTLHIPCASVGYHLPCVVVVEEAVEEQLAIPPWTKGIPAHREFAGLPVQCSTLGRARKPGQEIR